MTCVLCSPRLWQQPVQLAHGQRRNASQQAGQVGLRVLAVPFSAGDEGVERGGPLGGDVMASEKPILPANPHPPQGAFGGVVVDVEVALGGVNLQCFPLVEHVADGLGVSVPSTPV
jgi:hypothetical protein